MGSRGKINLEIGCLRLPLATPLPGRQRVGHQLVEALPLTEPLHMERMGVFLSLCLVIDFGPKPANHR